MTTALKKRDTALLGPALHRLILVLRGDAPTVGAEVHASDNEVAPFRERGYCPVCASHTFTSPGPLPKRSPPPEAMRLPSGENFTLQIPLVCPLRVSVSCPV